MTVRKGGGRDLARLDDADVVARAAQGDRLAAGEYAARNLPTLRAMARGLAGAAMDPEDLVGFALLTIVERWAHGAGPQGDVNAYAYAIMRNRVRDELRSPRTRTLPLGEADSAVDVDGRARHIVELHREIERVRHALDTLSEDQRHVLVSTTYEGQLPRHLEESLGRPASAIYSLTRRAKLSLRRALIKSALAEDAPPACLRASEQLPREVTPKMEYTAESEGMVHIRSCRRCRAVWATTARVDTAYGVTGLIVLAQVAGLAGLGLPLAAKVAGGAAAVGSGAAATAAAAAAGTAAAAATAGATAATTALSASGTSWLAGALGRQGADTVLDAAVKALVLGGTGLTAAGLIATYVPAAHAPTAELDVSTFREGRIVDLSLSFDVPGAEWTMEDLRIEVPVGVSLTGSPDGWDCAADGGAISCATGPSGPGGVLEFTLPASAPDADADYPFTLELRAAVGSATVWGTVTGDLAADQTVEASG